MRAIAGFVRSLGYRVKVSDIDLLGDLGRVIDLNPEVANRAPDQGEIALAAFDLGDGSATSARAV